MSKKAKVPWPQKNREHIASGVSARLYLPSTTVHVWPQNGFCSALIFFLSGCYLVATDWTVGDILLWPDHGGIAEYFLSCDGRLFVYCEKLDIAPWPKV